MSIHADAEILTNVTVGGSDRSALVYNVATHTWYTKDQAGTTAPLVLGVSSFVGRTGIVVALAGDYSAFYDATGAATAAQAAAVQRANHTGTQLAATISDFNEAAQDAIGAALVDTSTIDFAYNDAANTISAIVIDASITNAKLANMATATFRGRTTAGTGSPEDLTATQATALLDVATPVLKGLMSATDKSSLDSFVAAQLYYNVKDYGATGNGSNDDLASINAAITAIPSGATLYFPRGTYKITGTISVPVGKSISFLGGGAQKSTITTNHATLDMVTVGDWGTNFSDISFGTSVTRTGGYAVNGGSYNGGFWIVYMNFQRCSFAGMFNGILCNGTLCWFKDLSFTNTVNFSIEFGGLGPAGFQAPNTGLDGPNVNSLIHNCTFDCAPASVAHIEVKQCGSLIISDCDIIRATNNLRLNPSTTLKGVFSVYCCNTFFDTAGGSSVKFMGNGNIQRAKFTNCWFSGSVNGCEFASTATLLPTGIDFVNCDLFSNSVNGILATAVQDFAISNSRISANATAGINIAAAAGAVTKFNIQNNSIGPTAGLGANGIGINVAAGTYGGYNITGNVVSGNTSNNNIIDAGTVATTDLSKVGDNAGHLIKGSIASIGAAVSTPVTTETVVLTARIPANAVRIGQVFRIRAEGVTAAISGTSTYRVRCGAAGTAADASIPFVSKATAAGVANGRTGCEVYLTVRSATTVQAEGMAHSEAAFVTAAVGAATTPAIVSTAPWFITLTVVNGASAVAFQQAVVEAL